MKTIISIEGIRGSGKTYLANFLSEIIQDSSIIPNKKDYNRVFKEAPLFDPTDKSRINLKESQDYFINFTQKKIIDSFNISSNISILDRDYFSLLAFSYGCSSYLNDFDIFKRVEDKVSNIFLNKRKMIPTLRFLCKIDLETYLERILNRNKKIETYWLDERFVKPLIDYYNEFEERYCLTVKLESNFTKKEIVKLLEFHLDLK